MNQAGTGEMNAKNSPEILEPCSKSIWEEQKNE